MKLTTFGLASAIALTAAAPAFAQTTEAKAAVDLNIRSGPGPYYDVVGVISGGDTVAVDGCLEKTNWCKITYDGTTGWSSSDYLAVGVNDMAVALTQRPETVKIKTVTYEDTSATTTKQAAGAAAGATIGAIAAYTLGGPIGGIVASGILGAAGGAAAVEPSTKTITFVRDHPVDTVYLDGEVVVGAGIPAEVTTYEAPQPEFRYAKVNGVTVLVDAKTNTIVKILR